MKNGMEEGTLHKWFKGSKSKDGKGGWVNVVTGGTCASDEPGEGTPKCVSSAKRASMSKAERLSAARRKKAADPGQQQKTGAAKPTYVSTDKKKMKKEEAIIETKDKKGKGSGKKDACYHKVKSRYSVWPSAYASGALVKCRKVGAKNWGNKSEEVEIEEKKAQKCWPGYEKKGTKKMFGKTYNNCVKKEGITFSQFRESVDKSKMKCNKPKAQSVGDSKTGKSHVVKACENGKEKIIRFGQRGVKGSPKKEGESQEYAARRKAFKDRHAKNIAKGKMSAAYWANKVKW